MAIFENVKNIKGVGEKTARLLNRLNIYTVEDLINYFPRDYINYGEPMKVNQCTIDSLVSIRLYAKNSISFKQGKRVNIGSVPMSDGEKDVNVVFFNAPYLKSKFPKGSRYIFYGKLSYEGGVYRMEQPAFYTEGEYEALKSSRVPVYPLTKGLSNNGLKKIIKTALDNYIDSQLIKEYLDLDTIEKFQLIDRCTAYRNIHFPKNEEELLEARKRLIFDEFFLFIALIKGLKENDTKPKTQYRMIETAGPNRLVEKLPYRLTDAQLKVFKDVCNDLSSEYVMNRLIEGDVGSGKTVVSFLSILMSAENGYQSALMAPTEILATQHYEKLCDLKNKYDLPLNICLLTGSLSAKKKSAIYEGILNNEYNVIIGTHALFQEKVKFNNLALVITDEQHRFGVKQRKGLSLKGGEPHVLVMSATPIPRTLAMILYGDMHLSVIDEKPSMRLPIKNCVVDTSYRNTAYNFMMKQIGEGRQVYIICPMVEASEEMPNIENVIDYTEKLRQIFPSNIRVGTLHGRMKADEKKYIMDAFLERNIDVLVSTTVIEVGIDVPNATVMMVENAERFGLAQLHQLRGRIGRGDSQSYCIFINGKKSDSENQRLKILNENNDGFKIAEEDLKLRGAGDLFGVRQSGEMEFKIADIYNDSGMLLKINEYIEENDVLNNPKIKDYITENGHKFIDFGTI